MLFVGNDWAEDHHDVFVMNEAGDRLGGKRFDEGIAGVGAFHEFLAGYGHDPGEVVIGIETDRGLWVHALVGAGYHLYAVNPLSVARYRERHSVSGAKSDPGDAKVLADLVRTDRQNHRRLVPDSVEAEAIKILARAHQNLVWTRVEHVNRLRSTLREYYPGALDTFADLAHRDAITILTRAPSPELGRRLRVTQIRAALKTAGRQRNLDTVAEQIYTGLQQPRLDAPPTMANAFAASTSAQLAIIATLNTQITELETGLTDHFGKHPDADIYLSLPGLGVILSARVLGEFGDNPNRFTTAKSRRNYAGTSPITIASGRKRSVTARHVRNKRLYTALDAWAFSAITQSPGCRALYDRHRTNGDLHHQALRALANRLTSILHGCLKHQTQYDEQIAWNQPTTKAA